MKQGHDPYIAAVFVDWDDMPDEAADVAYILPVNWLSRLCSKNRVAFFLLGPLALFYIAFKASSSADIINPHNFPSHWIAALIGRIRRIPVIWTCNEPPAPLSRAGIREIGMADYLGWLLASSPIDGVFVRGLTAIHVLSERVRSEIHRRYGKKSTIIRTGVNLEVFASGSAVRGRSNHDLEGRFVLLAVGKLHPQKNHIECIRALKEVCSYLPDPILLIAGDGPMRRALEQEATQLNISESVRFLGRVSMPELADLYAACDINLFPALNQSWGLTPFEALCAETISIVSQDSGAAEIIKAEGIGLVCEPNSRAIADRILEVHSSPSKIARMAESGHRFVQKNLTRTRFAEGFAKLADSVISINEGNIHEIAAVSNMDISQ